jgi:hypothetical protein
MPTITGGNMPPVLKRVRSVEELLALEANLRLAHKDELLLFRGQTELPAEVRSKRARPNVTVLPDVEAGWSAFAAQMLEIPISRGHSGFVKAVLQHYGMATHFVDLTSDIAVAAWFATHRFSSERFSYIGNAFRFYDVATYSKIENGVGYVLVLALHDFDTLTRTERLYDLQKLPTTFVRPHRQKGWLMLDRPPTQPNPSQFWIGTIEIDASSFSHEPANGLFPSAADDSALAQLTSVPFVQVPLGYFRAAEKGGSPEGEPNIEDAKQIDSFCAAERLLKIPEYSSKVGGDTLRHKWDDFTLYEPHPMRMWKRWLSDLGAIHLGSKGNIRDCTKIMLSPSAKAILANSIQTACSWPALNNDGLFFTFAEVDHDKVSNHGPLYEGVWLQRDDDLIIETPMQADNETLSTTLGHAYLLREGKLVRQQMAAACPCPFPESHDERVGSVLRLSGLVAEGKIILLPHPRLWEWCYVAISGNDTQFLALTLRVLGRSYPRFKARR